MSILNKLKKGASEAGEKAKVMLEVNKVKMQQSQIQKELENEFKKMGEIVFEMFQKGNFDGLLDTVEENCNNCIKKKQEIQDLGSKIKELNNKRECPNCKNEVEIDKEFCPSCGNRLDMY